MKLLSNRHGLFLFFFGFRRSASTSRRRISSRGGGRSEYLIGVRNGARRNLVENHGKSYDFDFSSKVVWDSFLMVVRSINTARRNGLLFLNSLGIIVLLRTTANDTISNPQYVCSGHFQLLGSTFDFIVCTHTPITGNMKPGRRLGGGAPVAVIKGRGFGWKLGAPIPQKR